MFYVVALVLVAVIGALFIAGHAPAMRAATLNEQIANQQAPLIVDTRTTGEYRAGHIPGAMHLPFHRSHLANQLMNLPRDRPVVIYCAHGPRAWWTAIQFKRAGFDTIFHLKGHMTGWRKAGLPES